MSKRIFRFHHSGMGFFVDFLGNLVHQRHLRLVSAKVVGCVRIVPIIVKESIAHLLVSQFYGIMEDSVVNGIVGYGGIFNCHIDKVHPRAFVFLLYRLDGVCQVNDIAHLSFLEERSISLTIDLLHFPFHGRQLYHVFTSKRVGLHHNALAIHFHHRHIVGGVALLSIMVNGITL